MRHPVTTAAMHSLSSPSRSLFLFFVLLVLLSLAIPCHSSLLSTILVSRHGTRAPNTVTARLCPANDANVARYSALDISLEGVTGRGMHQLYQLGEYSREQYVDSGFLRPYYSNEEMYIRAVGEDRTLQSAVAWGQGLYPAGHGPVGWLSNVPPPLPVYTLPDEVDVLLENRKAGCHQRLKADVEHWDETAGAQQITGFRPLLAQLEALCGVNLSAAIIGSGDNYGDAIKDITDSWTFDFIEHFPPVPGLTLETLLQFRAFAVQQLIGRILGTEEQVTYLNGDLPASMLGSFEAAVSQHRHNASEAAEGEAAAVRPLKFIAYHGHREMMYALAAYFDIRYNITYPALPLGAIPPATSLFFELHHEKDSGSSSGRHSGKRSKKRSSQHEEEEDDDGEDSAYVIKAVLWSPCDSEEVTDAHQLITPDLSATRQQAVNISHQYYHSNASHLDNTSYALHNASSHLMPAANSSSAANHSAVHNASVSSPSPPVHLSRSEKQCGGRPIAISKCPRGVCSIAQFRRLIAAQEKATGPWRQLCRYDDDTGKESWDETRADDTKVAGAGRTRKHSGDDRGGSSRHHGSSGVAAGKEGDDTEGETASTGWLVALGCVFAALLIGGLLYWWFFMRGRPDRSEYRPMPAGRS